MRAFVFLLLAGCDGFVVDITTSKDLSPLADLGSTTTVSTTTNTTGSTSGGTTSSGTTSGTSGGTTSGGTTSCGTTSGGTTSGGTTSGTTGGTSGGTTGGGTTGSSETCSVCQNKAFGASGICETQGDACSNDNRCQTIQICASNCGSNSNTACIQSCAGGTIDPTAMTKFQNAASCICNTACTSECSSQCK
jgi:hypothetical protein